MEFLVTCDEMLYFVCFFNSVSQEFIAAEVLKLYGLTKDQSQKTDWQKMLKFGRKKRDRVDHILVGAKITCLWWGAFVHFTFFCHQDRLHNSHGFQFGVFFLLDGNNGFIYKTFKGLTCLNLELNPLKQNLI